MGVSTLNFNLAVSSSSQNMKAGLRGTPAYRFKPVTHGCTPVRRYSCSSWGQRVLVCVHAGSVTPAPKKGQHDYGSYTKLT